MDAKVAKRSLASSFASSGPSEVDVDAVMQVRHNTNVKCGPHSLAAATEQTTHCTAVGDEALMNNTAPETTAVGAGALHHAVTAQACTAFGFQALSQVTDKTVADDNTAVGHRAAMSTNAPGNTAVGAGSLAFNESGRENTAAGAHSAALNVSGHANSVFGYDAGYGITDGSDNTVMGHGAQRAVAPVSRVTVYGSGALTDNTVGGVLAVGYHALHSTQTGEHVTAVGCEAMENAVSASHCSAFGAQALRRSWGSDNSIFGSQGMSKGGSTGGENTGIGSHVLVNNISSRNTAAGYKALFSNQMGHHNTAVGYMSLCKCNGGTKNTALGGQSGANIVEGQCNVAFGFQAGPATDLEDTICIGAGARATHSGELCLASAGHPLITSKMVGDNGDAAPAPQPQLYLTVIVNGERYLLPLYKPAILGNE